MERRNARRLARRLSVVVLVGSTACGAHDGPTPAAGAPSGRVVGPNGTQGAAVVEFDGVVDSIVVPGGRGFLETSGGRTRAALVLDQPGTIRFTLPRATSPAPNAAVLQVADGANRLAAAADAYRVEYDR